MQLERDVTDFIPLGDKLGLGFVASKIINNTATLERDSTPKGSD
jgi:hypothetical protein